METKPTAPTCTCCEQKCPAWEAYRMALDKFYNRETKQQETIDSISEVLKSYRIGFLTGFNWPDAWAYVPGGPSIIRCYPCRNCQNNPKNVCDCKQRHETSIAQRNAWIQGWKAGNKEKVFANRSCSLPTSEATSEVNAGKRESNLW